MPFFTTLDPKRLANEIDRAGQRVVMACAGIQPVVAGALIGAHRRLQPGAVKVVLDVADGVARLGYGDFECVQRLHDAGVDVRHHEGLRIGVLICDAQGWAFATAARLVEADPTTDVDAFNAVALTEAQILQLCSELPQVRAHLDGSTAPTPVAGTDTGAALPADAPLVGEIMVTADMLKHTAGNLKQAPPQPFDLARQAQMYSALVQFAELTFKGFKLESRRVALPRSLPVIASKSKEVKDRLTASYKLLAEAAPKDVKDISNNLDALRDSYLIPVGRAGRVILKAKRDAFLAELGELKKRLEGSRAQLTESLRDKIDAVVESLVPELARAVLADPPDLFRGRYPQDEEGAHEYVRRELRHCMPSAVELTRDMQIHHFFKNVTYEVLKDKGFCERVRSELPESVVKSGLLNEQTVAQAARPA